jgi:hypothetical protein
MIELNLYQNNNQTSEYYKKWYARANYKQEINIPKLAKLLKVHNTNWSEGAIAGVLTDMVKEIREQTLMGNTVKIDDLAIFKCSVESQPVNTLYDAQNDIVIKAVIGPKTARDPKTGLMKPTGNAVKNIKLLAQATGDYTRAELNKDAVLGWTDLAQSQIDAAKQPEPEP